MTRSVFGSIIFTFISKLSPSTILFKHNVRQNKISARKISRYLIMTSSKQTAEDKPLAIWGNRGELSLVSTRMIGAREFLFPKTGEPKTEPHIPR